MFQDIEDVVAFVKWLDDELCFLVSQLLIYCSNIYHMLLLEVSSQLLILNYEFASIG